MMTVMKIKLKLYVTGRSSRSERAIVQLQRICSIHLADRYELEIVDVLEHPELAEKDRILATPTLIRMVPPPSVRIVGDLSDEQAVLYQLDIGVS
jgi:circadian clock protein KaiB